MTSVRSRFLVHANGMGWHDTHNKNASNPQVQLHMYARFAQGPRCRSLRSTVWQGTFCCRCCGIRAKKSKDHGQIRSSLGAIFSILESVLQVSQALDSIRRQCSKGGRTSLRPFPTLESTSAPRYRTYVCTTWTQSRYSTSLMDLHNMEPEMRAKNHEKKPT